MISGQEYPYPFRSTLQQQYMSMTRNISASKQIDFHQYFTIVEQQVQTKVVGPAKQHVPATLGYLVQYQIHTSQDHGLNSNIKRTWY